MADRFLSEELEAEIRERVSRELWDSPDQFVRHSIKAADILRNLRTAIAEGDAQISRGESTDGEEFFDRLEAELDHETSRETGE
jgi:Arc/MetJ-type ribon-helix-helix transcriptional regulator